jgi:ferrous iron transport protein B
MWERSSAFVRKAGVYILAAAIVIWFLLNMPWGVDDQRDSWFGHTGATISHVLEPAGFGNWEASGALVSGFVAKETVVSTMSEIYVGGTEDDGKEFPSTPAEVGDIFEGGVRAVRDSIKAIPELVPGVLATAPSEETELQAALKPVFSQRAAVAFLVFVLLYVPCVASLAAFRQEFGWRWAGFAAVYYTAVAWVVAVVVYQGAGLLGVG